MPQVWLQQVRRDLQFPRLVTSLLPGSPAPGSPVWQRDGDCGSGFCSLRHSPPPCCREPSSVKASGPGLLLADRCPQDCAITVPVLRTRSTFSHRMPSARSPSQPALPALSLLPLPSTMFHGHSSVSTWPVQAAAP